MIAHFSDPTFKLRLFLISTRAGGQGLNLAAASRVIVFDASWNPATDTQAVFRSYRYGQMRPVHVYRLIAQGFEQCLYCQQVVKPQLAGRVLDEQSHVSGFSHDELKDLWRLIPPSLPVSRSALTSAVASLPPTSWVDHLVEAAAGWLVSVEDHDKRLEGEEEALDAVDMEEAENELRKDENALPRESAICELCGKAHSNIP
jgi:transcriptional regulator ATRX